MEPLKNELSAAKVRTIGSAIRRVHPGFPMDRYQRGLEDALEPLELKQRVRFIAERIGTCLPEDPKTMFPILTGALAVDDMRGFLVWPLTEVVARRGLGHFVESMRALREMTCRFTAEFAIRPFLRAMPEKTLRQLHQWCDDPDHHVRRLVSEGSRPFLPWGGNLTELLDPPHPTLGLLEKLHRDPSDYVRLSVSNHLNDISKRHPELVVGTLARWRKSAPRNRHWEKLARHASRTLIKQGHPAALDLHGFGAARLLEVVSLKLGCKTVKLGEFLDYELVIRNLGRGEVRVLFDYAIHHRKANGSLSPKVFKGRVKPLAAGGTWHVRGSHPIKPVTTRVYHSGIHLFEPRINGMAREVREFKLVLPDT
ncbi:MAG: DNA alkylation repair protein [Luteolibacter sp.]